MYNYDSEYQPVQNFCQFCGLPCGAGGFCDALCYDAYEEASRIHWASQADELPGESRHAGDDFPPEWDVNGGL